MTTTAVWTVTQQGNLIGGAFSEGSPLGIFLTSGPAGGDAGSWIFDAATGQGVSFATVGGQLRILDGPVVMSWTLAFSVVRLAGGAGIAACTFEVGLVPGGPTANYSSTLKPWLRNERSMGTVALTVPVSPTDPIDTTLTPTTALLTLSRALVTSRAAWNGKVGLSIRQFSGDPTVVSPGATLTVTQEPAFTGLAGYGREQGRVRAVRDTRYGIPTLSSRLVQDGDNEGLWVFPWDRDEEDPPNRYRPSPREGGKDDKIPG